LHIINTCPTLRSFILYDNSSTADIVVMILLGSHSINKHHIHPHFQHFSHLNNQIQQVIRYKTVLNTDTYTYIYIQYI